MSESVSKHIVNYLLIDEDQLSTINRVINTLDKLIRKDITEEGINMLKNIRDSLIEEYQLSTLNYVINILDKYIRKDTPIRRYNIESIEIQDNGELIEILVHMLDTNIKLQYVITRYDKSEYNVDHITLPYYFEDLRSIDSVFRSAISFMVKYIGGDEKLCRIIDFSFTNGEFSISIPDSVNKCYIRRFKFKIEYDSDERIIGVNYYGNY